MSVEQQEITYIGYDEEWRFIILDGEVTKYQVSNLGRIRNTKRHNRILKQVIDKYGYKQVCLSHNNIHHSLGVHRLVALAFIKNDDPVHRTQVNHKDGNKLRNAFDNLEWTTPKENIIHAYRNGLHDNVAIGERHGHNKYLTSEIIKICEVLSSGHSLNETVNITGLPKSLIRDIYYRRYWTHLSKSYDFSKVKYDSPRDFSANKNTIIRLFNEGNSISDICKVLNIPSNERNNRCINYYIKRYCG